MKTAVIIVAAGSGRRFGSKTPKQFIKLHNIPLFLWSVIAFKKVKNIKQVILVVPENRIKSLQNIKKKFNISITAGGKERFDSVKAGLKILDPEIEYVAIHDGARPLIKPKLISQCINSASQNGAAIIAVQARDTIKICDSKMMINKTIPRDMVWMAQTPQIFKRSLIEKAYKNLKFKNITDDAQVLELIGKKAAIVPGDYENIKITDKPDMKKLKSSVDMGRKR